MAQKLYLVFGGQLVDPSKDDFADPTALKVVGIFPSYKQAYDAWRGASQATIDDALMRFMIVHLHDLSPANLDREG